MNFNKFNQRSWLYTGGEVPAMQMKFDKFNQRSWLYTEGDDWGKAPVCMQVCEFYNKYGTDTTNNFQLLQWAKQLGLKNFQVLMRDEIKEQKVKPLMNIICNIEQSYENGAHWSAFYKAGKTHIWFDSYGRPPDEEIINKFGKGTILSSNYKIQEFGTSLCGQLSLFVLYKLNSSVKYEKIILDIL